MDSTTEIMKAFVSPTEKLLDMVRGAIGKAYEPRYRKRLADAVAYEIEKIGQAVRENSDIPIIYDKGLVSMDTRDYDAFIKRTQNRLAFQELTKQKNIETVVDIAYTELAEQPNVANDPVDQDWINTFFDSVANVSTEQMQILWGKLLAGEVQCPGTYSLRTLSVLRTLTQNEATIFARIAPLILKNQEDGTKNVDNFFLIIGAGYELLEKYNVPFADILRLSEAGLISENSSINIVFDMAPGQTELIRGLTKAIELKNLGDDRLTIQQPTYCLTEVGKELLPIVYKNESEDELNQYMEDCLTEIKNYPIGFNGGPADFKKVSIEIVEYS